MTDRFTHPGRASTPAEDPQRRAPASGAERLASLLLGTCLLASPASAALVVVDYVSADGLSFDLTTLGTGDWAYWSTTSNPAGGTPTNRQSGSTIIGDLTTVGGGSLRGSSSSVQPTNQFTFSDGTSPSSGTVSQPTGLFNTQLDSVGVGVALEFTLPAAQTYQIHLWGSVLEGQGTLSTSLAGAADTDTVINATGLSTDLHKGAGEFTLTVTTDHPGDVLSVSFVLSQDLGNPAHTLISGATVTAVPEPASISLLAALGCLLLVRRRR